MDCLIKENRGEAWKRVVKEMSIYLFITVASSLVTV
jgi:hypothetical protein